MHNFAPRNIHHSRMKVKVERREKSARSLWGLCVAFLLLMAALQVRAAVVVDAVSRRGLAGVSVFDRRGNAVGASDRHGRLPYAPAAAYPLTLRCLGYAEATLQAGADTVLLHEHLTELPEFVVERRKNNMVHILAYVREYSTLSTYTDTVTLFREKMVDYMLPIEKKGRYKGWRRPRVIASRSYYRFTNAAGLDSVSSECAHHFSWSDWVGLAPTPSLPAGLRGREEAADTLRGRYSATETWTRHDDRVRVEVDVLADTVSRRWVPELDAFFQRGLDFERFRVAYAYENVTEDSIRPQSLTGYTLSIESNGRGRTMFIFGHSDQPFWVTTYAQVWVLDRELVSVAEARRWERGEHDGDRSTIIEAADAPELRPETLELVSRVDAENREAKRLVRVPDQKLKGRPVRRQHFGQRVLHLLKEATGISTLIERSNEKKEWRKFKDSRSQPKPQRE